MGFIYLDHQSGTPLHPRVKEAMSRHMETIFGNPMSDHQVGQPAAEALEKARSQVTALINAKPAEVVFTSGGTESNNHAIKGVAIGLREKGRHIITSNIEHKSVLNSLRTLRLLDYRVTSLDVDSYGLVDPGAVEKAITPDTILISIMMANNEIGTIEPIAEIARIAQKHKIIMHTDAVAAVGNIPVDVQELGVNLLSLAANQFYGPPGVGALYVRKGTPVWPLLDGGTQENKRRAGTENLIGIVGLGVAAELAREAIPTRQVRLRALKERLEQGIKARIPEIHINGHLTKNLPHLLSVSVEYIEGESLMLMLDDEDIVVATRSACASGSLRASHVLIGTGMDFATAQGTLVFTLGEENTDADIDRVLQVMPGIVQTLREMSPLYKKSAG
ncbi:MAG: cysteine desulfurase [Deltaproteobacteria bacterium]|nr:cysteine desulfurase [Deltaproteobacteria bacterium]MBI4794403.1 cysteine desulfurase [Deltaproteobacteria bacterium]